MFRKVKKVLIVVELENGNALVASPTEIGKIDELVTLKELQRALGNSENSEADKFLSPFVFALDLQDAGRKWMKYIDEFDRGDREYKDLEGFDRDIDFHYWHRELLIEWIRKFFDLGYEDD